MIQCSVVSQSKAKDFFVDLTFAAVVLVIVFLVESQFWILFLHVIPCWKWMVVVKSACYIFCSAYIITGCCDVGRSVCNL